ncbi:MAG: hypothetical protein BMS9Abin31_1154 [Gammaproteobacteria bacterium]|nr:MAG: hypothetical protein BMS9Abin31_1154 [Gammaproteobacteria bacterium]
MFTRNYLYRVIVLVVVIYLLFVPTPTNSLWWREAFNSGHTVLFVILSFFIYRQLKVTTRFSNDLAIYFLVLFIGLLFGVLIELLQKLVQREASLSDFYGDFFGLMAGLCLIAAYNLKKIQYKKLTTVFLIITGTVFLFTGVYPLIKLSWHYIERFNAFPVIADFDSNWSSSFVRFNNVDMLWVPGSKQDISLYPVRFNQGIYPAISVFETEPDWSNYQVLRMNIFSENEDNIVLGLRIHDDKHNQDSADRFNKKLIIQPGLNEIKISLNQVRHGPVNRELDLANVAAIKVFSSKLDEHILLEVSNIYLE